MLYLNLTETYKRLRENRSDEIEFVFSRVERIDGKQEIVDRAIEYQDGESIAGIIYDNTTDAEMSLYEQRYESEFMARYGEHVL